MNKAEVLQRILEVGIVPVIRAASSEDALSATEALYQGGLPIAEITMTVPGAVAAIRSLVQQRSRDILIGAGTVLDVQTSALKPARSSSPAQAWIWKQWPSLIRKTR